MKICFFLLLFVLPSRASQSSPKAPPLALAAVPMKSLIKLERAMTVGLARQSPRQAADILEQSSYDGSPIDLAARLAAEGAQEPSPSLSGLAAELRDEAGKERRAQILPRAREIALALAPRVKDLIDLLEKNPSPRQSNDNIKSVNNLLTGYDYRGTDRHFYLKGRTEEGRFAREAVMGWRGLKNYKNISGDDGPQFYMTQSELEYTGDREGQVSSVKYVYRASVREPVSAALKDQFESELAAARSALGVRSTRALVRRIKKADNLVSAPGEQQQGLEIKTGEGQAAALVYQTTLPDPEDDGPQRWYQIPPYFLKIGKFLLVAYTVHKFPRLSRWIMDLFFKKDLLIIRHEQRGGSENGTLVAKTFIADDKGRLKEVRVIMENKGSRPADDIDQMNFSRQAGQFVRLKAARDARLSRQR